MFHRQSATCSICATVGRFLSGLSAWPPHGLSRAGGGGGEAPLSKNALKKIQKEKEIAEKKAKKAAEKAAAKAAAQ